MKRCAWTPAWLGAAMLAALMMSALVATAGTSPWCGENGLIRFSFVAGDSLVSVWHTEAGVNGVTEVDLYAWLTDVDPVARKGEAFLRVGGAEFKLSITGAEGFITLQEFPGETLNVGQGSGTVAVGYAPGQRLQNGRTELVHWRIMFQGRPENVRFGLDPAGLVSSRTVPECDASGTQAMYAGAPAANMIDVMFGAGYVPAWLNPAGEPDQQPVVGDQSWRDVGVFAAREVRARPTRDE